MKIIVVVSQSGGSFERRDFEETLIATLLMEAEGIEVTVVPDISELDSDTTGLLCLEGIKGDMIFASWHEPQVAFRGLAEKGIYGRFGKTKQSPTAPAEELPLGDAAALQPGVYDAMQRRIYCLDLSGFGAVPELRQEIERIAQENSVQTVQVLDLGLGLSNPPSPSAASKTPNSIAEEDTSEQNEPAAESSLQVE